MNKIVRTHDLVYLNENRYENTKESFKFIGEFIKEKRIRLGLSKNIEISDWGRANGEFAYYLRKIFPSDSVTGYDLLPELVQKSREQVPSCNFYEASILNKESAPLII